MITANINDEQTDQQLNVWIIHLNTKRMWILDELKSRRAGLLSLFDKLEIQKYKNKNVKDIAKDLFPLRTMVLHYGDVFPPPLKSKYAISTLMAIPIMC